MAALRWILFACLAAPGVAPAQESTPDVTPIPEASPSATPEPPATPIPASLDDAPRLFLDCSYYCDFAYVRENVQFVVFVRDRADADVHVIVTALRDSAGGQEFTIRFLGRGRFEGMHDVLRAPAPVNATDDERRAVLTRSLRLGLLRYAAKTRASYGLDVSYAPPADPIAPKEDPWHRWVMSLSANGYFQGEETYRDEQGNGSIAAARVTEDWKVRSSIYLYLYETRYDFGDGETAESFRRDVGGSLLVGRSLGPHVTAGVRPSWSASTFTNIRSQYSGAGILEYSVFPYAEASRRALVLQYALRGNRAFYYEETIFGMEDEALFQQSAQASLGLTQRWGSIFGSVDAASYLHDLDKNRLDASATLNLRVARGLSLSLGGRFSVIRDQLYLPKGDATEEEILLRRRQLATDYDYTSTVGLTYVFGSIYTPVVNTRLD